MDKAAMIKEKKKKWREKQYKSQMGSKAEGHGFAEKRKQKFVYDYKKLLRKESQKEEHKSGMKKGKPRAGGKKAEPGDKKVVGRYHKAQQEFKRKRDDKIQVNKEKAEKRKQMQDAMEKYNTKKKGKQKLMLKKNFRGQPNMASRMTLLLSKIEDMQKS